MSEQDRFVPGVPNWVDLRTPDPHVAQEFYGALFGWTFTGTDHRLAQLDGGAVGGVSPTGAGGSARWDSYVLVDSVGATAERVRSAGGRVLGEPTDLHDAVVLAVADPAGAEFGLWEPRGRRGADVVNAHGAVNFNDLHTPDTPAAAAFYGAVFGWRVLDLGGGSAMWAMTTYGDHLEARAPGTRESYAAMGGPVGFEDVVASVGPVDGPGGGTGRAHWGVTFAVDDADACVGRVADLGGTVLTPPVDAAWTRSALLQDPQGATFVVSQFVPPTG